MSTKRLNFDAVSPGFQFHYGSIVRRNQRQCLKLYHQFQFHYGSIVRKTFDLIITCPDFISIPLWFDCESIAVSVDGLRWANFNSTMVRL